MFWGCSGAPWGPGGARPSRGPAWPGPRGTPGLLGPGPRPGGPALYRAPPSSRTGPSATSPNRKGPSSALMGAHPSGPLERTVNNYFGAGCSRYFFPSQRRRRGRQRGPILRGGKKGLDASRAIIKLTLFTISLVVLRCAAYLNLWGHISGRGPVWKVGPCTMLGPRILRQNPPPRPPPLYSTI